MKKLMLGMNDLSHTLSFRTNAFFYHFVHDYLSNVFKVRQSFVARTIFEMGVFDVLSEIVAIDEEDLLKKEEIDFSILEEMSLKTLDLLRYLTELDKYEEEWRKKSIKISWEVIYYVLQGLSEFYFSNLQANIVKRLLNSSVDSFENDKDYDFLLKRKKTFWSKVEPILKKYWGDVVFSTDKECVISFLLGLRRTNKPFLKKLRKEPFSSIDSMKLWRSISIAFLVRIILDLALVRDRLVIKNFTTIVKTMLTELSGSEIFIFENNTRDFVDGSWRDFADEDADEDWDF
jgi:hypothetical protein